MKRIFRCIAAFLFLLYILFLPGRAESANASVYHNLRNYTVDDGLSSNHVYGIVQDSIGFIWFGTDNGLCRFDGCEFRCYTHTDGVEHFEQQYPPADARQPRADLART